MGKLIGFRLGSVEDVKVLGRNKYDRDIDIKHLKKVKREMIHNLYAMDPIRYNVVTNNTIDGKHRRCAFIELVEEGSLPKDSVIPLQMLEMTEAEENIEIKRCNEVKKSWGQDDYISSSIRSGNEYYSKLLELGEKLNIKGKGGKVAPRNVAPLLGPEADRHLKDGLLTFTEKSYLEAPVIHSELSEIKDVLSMKGSDWGTYPSMVKSWMKVRNLHPFDVWMKQLKKHKRPLQIKPKRKICDWDDIFSNLLRYIETD